ncbi:alpha-2-macroglobulin [Prosthecobacter sp.]|uniref:alpha-2-macroglobulin n=1 Tax=Prosthecobacter sp. TaxID=1965333 RepID=UPI002ABCF6AC|nr:alpha-2-macroglobulin [Prosthecobacter sp.]MDZ4404365.1 alpha-2-macroglobulin [Prosthecobacter sp.]
MNLRRLAALPRAIGQLGSAVFGNFQWRPPGWARRLCGSLKAHPRGYAFALIILGALTFAGMKGWNWWEAHRARPRELTAMREATVKLVAPGLATIVNDQRVPTKLRLDFSVSVAPLKAVGEPNPPGLSLSPDHPGKWRWVNDKSLLFEPTNDWPADTEFAVTFKSDAVAKEVILKQTEWNFTTPKLDVSLPSVAFYTDPQDPTVHQIVAEVKTSHPVALAELEQRVKVEVLGGTPVFAWKGQTPASLFKITEGKHQQQFWIRSTRIAVPEKEDFVKVTVQSGLPTLNGGKALLADQSDKARVPDTFSGLRIQAARTEIIRTEEGEPEQFLFIDTTGYAASSKLAEHVEMWLLPKDKPAEGKKPVSPDHDWQAGEVSPAIIAASKKVTLTSVESAAPFTEMHAFKFLLEDSGRLYVRVRGGLEGLGGFKVADDVKLLVNVPDFPQEIDVLGRGAVLSLNGERKLSVKSRGHRHLRYTLARVPAGQVNHLITLTEGDFEAPQFLDKWAFNEENIARIRREVLPVAMKNSYQANYSIFDFTPEIGRTDISDPDASRGLFFLTAEGVRPRTDDDGEAEEDDDDPKWIREGNDEEGVTRRFVLVTDLGLLVKQNADGSREVFVQSIQNGGPVNGARVIIVAKNGEYLAESTTADGHAHFDDVSKLKREKQPVAILARLGNDLAFIPFERVDRALDFSRFDTEGVLASEKERLDAFVFTERGVYRPGDTVHVGAIVRRLDWQGALAGLPVEIEVTDAQDRVIDTERLSLPQDGYLNWDFDTNEADPTGVYRVSLYLMKKNREEEYRERIGRTVFRVEDFQPDRMKLATELSKPAGAGWVQPGDLNVKVNLQTLFGFPAEGRRIVSKMDLSPADFFFEQHPGFTFHNRLRDESKNVAGKTIELGETKTNAEGHTEVDLSLERFGNTCFRMNLLVEAFEADGGRSMRGGLSALVSPFAHVIGYKADGDLGYIGKDSARNVKLLAVDMALKPVAVPQVSWRVIRIRHVSVLTKQESGSYAYVSTAREETASEGPLTLTETGADFALPTTDAGEFRLEVRDGENRVVCACPFSVVGKGEADRSLEREAELEMKLARDTWNDGESIELSLKAPYTGAGLITIEREKVLAWQWFTSSTTSSVQHITLPPGQEGTAYVNAAFVRALDSPEVFISPLSYAVAPFTANPDRRRMTVELDAPKIVKPGEVLKIGHRSAEASRIVVYAVDEGIHQITRYKLPEPLPHFFRKRALEVGTAQLLDLIMPELRFITKSSAFGGDEDEPPKLHLNPFKRRREAPVVFWSGVIDSGPDRREVTYQVPDYFAGSLKIMAVSVAAEKIGQSEIQSTVRGPFVLTPNVPVFAAPGDEFTVSLTVANNLDTGDQIALSLTSSEHLEVVESAPPTLQVAPGREATTRYRLRAKNMPGGAEMTFRAESGGQSIERRATLSVRPASPYMTQVQSGWFRLANQDLKVQRQMYPHFAKREATVSVLPLGLARGLDAYLRDYPHGCSEQITSRAMSRLLLADEADFGFSRAEAVQQLDDAFSLLSERQNSNGGFGYWSASTDGPLDFLSIYVTSFLTEARDAGFAVPEDLLVGARKHLKDMARAKITTLDEAWLQAAAIYLLTRHGEVTTPQLLNLRDTLQDKLKVDWRHDVTAAYIGATYALLQKPEEGRAIMQTYQSASRKPPQRWNGGYHADPQVRNALAFALLCRHFPELASALNYEQLSVITDPISRGQFNTITSACTILALKNYSALAKNGGLKVSIMSTLPGNPEPQPLTAESGGILTAKFAENASSLRFHLTKPDGAPDLGAFYQVIEAGFDKVPPQAAVADGLEVIRDLLGPDGKPITQLHTGQSATVRIRVRNTSGRGIEDVAVLDLMPGGFEIEPDNLKPGAGTMPGADFTEVREDRNAFFLRLATGEMKTFEYRIKPVCAGMFIIPPVFAESMYDRATKGRSLGGTMDVIPAP